ncbi:MAG: DUF2298 domain-containing protein, partial [Candidatus Promineifilaceae bacterium]|nr:DUF2298 domain-containing protein [Candidatus Promineifilaceae bacterium]
LGLAVASRINVAPLAAVAALAALLWLVRRARRAGAHGWRYLTTSAGTVDLQRAVLGVLLAAFVSLVVFRLAQPYAFADAALARNAALAETGQPASTLRVALESVLGFNPQWLNNMSEIQGLQSPEASFPPALQWTGRAPLLFPLTNMVLYGMGLAAGIAAWLGFFWALWRIARGRPDWVAHAIPVFWSGAYFLFMGTRWVKSIRYFLPIYPFLLLLGAWALVALWQRAGQQRGQRNARTARVVTGALIALVVLSTFLWANAFVGIYREPLTRVAASRWMFENLRTGATLLYEVDGKAHEQHLPLKGYTFSPGGTPLNVSFTPDETATLTGVRFNYLSTAEEASGEVEGEMRLELLQEGGALLSETVAPLAVGPVERAVTLELPEATIFAGEPYLLRGVLETSTGNSAVVADTTRIMNEEWDDLLPVSVDGRAAYAAYYAEVPGGQRPVTWPASEEKRRLMLEWIEEADVIALSSQRSLWNTPRLPLTYPLNIAYYEALFSGELGFELIAEFHAPLDIGPLYISDTGGEIGWGAPPEIGWPPPGELAAEEAFSVYDHPPVWIFEKTEAYSPERAEQILGAVDLSKVVVMNPGEATNAPAGMMLSQRELALQRANGTFGELFNLDGLLNRNPALAAAVWWLAILLLGWLAFPIAFVVFRGLPGRGYALARILSLLLLSWFAWITASVALLPHSRRTLLLGVLLMGALAIFILLRRSSEFGDWLRSNLPYVGLVEALALLLFAGGLVLRLGNPDVWDVIWGGEKPMDLAYFTAVLKSTTFPPYDPWYAGGYINYYYYGFVFVGVPTKLLGIVPTTAYNLILPMLYSLTGLGVFGVAYNLVHRIRSRSENNFTRFLRSPAVVAGVAAMLLAVLFGNLAEVGVLTGAWQRAGDSTVETGIGALDGLVQTVDGALATTIGGQPTPIYPGDWFWSATRAINTLEGEVGPITEFPFFTFLYGDLHAHMIALPLTMLALAWAVSLALQPVAPPEQRGASGGERRRFWQRMTANHAWWESVLLWFSGALAIGVLRPTNTWDWPTYLFLGMLAVAFYAYRARRAEGLLAVVGQAVLQIVALAALSTLLFWPYIANYGAGYESFRLWEGSYTYLTNYLIIYGLFLFLVGTHLAREFRAWSRTWTTEALERWAPAVAAGVAGLALYVPLLVLLVMRGYWIAPVALTLILLAGGLGLRPSLLPARRVILILIASALGLTLLVELVVLEGDIGRMNTVFKFYMQVWMMLSIAAGSALALAWPALRARSTGVRRGWQVALGLLVAAAALYPLLATQAKWDIRMNKAAPHTLDGMAFMPGTTYSLRQQQVDLAPDYHALRWMQRHIPGSPVVAEANPPNLGEAYRSTGSRVAVYTGLPTIIGWDWHQTQQRAALPSAAIRDRMADNAALFNTTLTGEALSLVEEYDVSYIYVGPLERIYYDPEGLAKFDEMANAGLLRVVYDEQGVTIYQVMGEQYATP